MFWQWKRIVYDALQALNKAENEETPGKQLTQEASLIEKITWKQTERVHVERMNNQ